LWSTLFFNYLKGLSGAGLEPTTVKGDWHPPRLLATDLRSPPCQRNQSKITYATDHQKRGIC